MSAETALQPDVLNMPWKVALDGDEGLFYEIPVVKKIFTQPLLPFLEIIPVRTEMPVPLFSPSHWTTERPIELERESGVGEQYPLFIPLKHQYGNGFIETPISDPRALKAVGMNPDQPVGVRGWAMRSFWAAYHGEIAHLDELHQTGKVSVEDYPSRMSDIVQAFGFDGPSNDLDGRVDIGSGEITNVYARVALAKQEDADRRAQRDTWRARYRAGAFGNTSFSAMDAGINEDELTLTERQERRRVETAIRGDAYMHRISPDGSLPVYAYKASIDRQHEAAVVDLQRAPEQRELAGMSQSARWARAGMPYLAVAERIAEFGDDVAKHVPPWVRPVVRGTARATAVFAGLAVAACSGFGIQPTHALPPPGGETSMPPTPHFTPEASATIGAPAEMVAVLPDALPEPGKPQIVAGLSSVVPGQGEVISLAPLDNRIALALNEQGVKPFVGKDDKGNSIFSADVSVDGKKVCLPAAPEQIANKNDPLQVFSYIPDGNVSPMVGFGSPDLLGEAGGSHNVIRYGATTNGQTDIAGILSPVLPSLENTDCAYGSVTDADKTPNPNDFNGAVVGVHFDKDGKIMAFNSPVLVDPDEVTINVQANGQVLIDGQQMENRVWVSPATSTPPPTFTPEPTATQELSASEQIDAMLDAAAPNGLAESRVPTNAGDMTFTFRMDEEGGPWQRLDLPQGQVDAVGKFFFGKLAVLQRYGTHPEDFSEMNGFPYTQYNWDYVNEVQRRVDARFAEGTPYTTGLLSYTQTHLYDYYPEFEGLEPNQPFYGFNVAQVALGEFNAMQQMLRDNKIPFVRANYRPGVSSEGHTETEWEVIVYMMTRDDGKSVLSFIAHSEHDSGMLHPSLRYASAFEQNRGVSDQIMKEVMINVTFINTIEPFKAKTGGLADLDLVLYEWNK